MRGKLLVAALCLALCIVGASGAAGTRSSIQLRQTALAAGETEWGCSVGLRVGRAQGGVLGLRGGGEDGEEEEEEAAGGDDEAAADDEMEEEEEEQEEEKDEGMNINKAIRQVLYYSQIHDGVCKGLKEVMQALEEGVAQLVLLADDCDEAKYVELVSAMCAEKGVYMLKVPEKKVLGEMAGQTRLDDDGNVKKTCAASSVAIKDFGEQSEGLAFLLNYIKERGGGEEGEGGDE